MRRIKHIHFIGIGGTGMCGIAEVLLNEDYVITGSDQQRNAAVERLEKLGAKIYIGHDKKHVKHADVVVVSTAIKLTNEEVQQAYALRIPVVPRAEMLAELMRFREGIAVAGTHGKTTTTSLVASVLAQGGLDPTFVIGGRLNSVSSNAKLGLGKYLVAEADESDASFLRLNPVIAVVTNIEPEHMETYGGDFSRLKDTFVSFLHRLPFYGLAILCIDDPVIEKLMPAVGRPTITYGFHKDADVKIENYQQKGIKSYFTVIRKNADKNLNICLNLPGEHNAQNALAAIAIATELDVSDDDILKAFESFAGVGRRFQLLGDYHVDHGKALFIDDYGHHPKEIAMTIKAARQGWPDQRLVMLFQPHRYTRTKALFEDFVKVLSSVDVLLLLDIYSAGEKPIKDIDSKHLSQRIENMGNVKPIYVEKAESLTELLNDVLRDNDIFIAQGAGSVSKVVSELLKNQKS